MSEAKEKTKEKPKEKPKEKTITMVRDRGGETRTVNAPVDDVPNMLKNGWVQVED